MTEQEIIENNKLIAEFLGLTKTNVEGCWGTCEYLENNPDSTLFCSVPFTEELYFNRSWDWLMPVVEKTLLIANELDDLEKFSIITDQVPYINEVYKAVVEFIKWYNGKIDNN